MVLNGTDILVEWLLILGIFISPGQKLSANG